MKRYQLHRKQQLYCDIDTAWAFFSSPHNLARITPRDMKFRVLTALDDADVYEGMIIDYTVSPLLHIPMRWRTVITEVKTKQSFADMQQKGPYTYWRHFHEFIPNEKGVLMLDTIDYELPMGFLGTLAHSLLVRRKLNQIFDYRQSVVDEILNKEDITL